MPFWNQTPVLRFLPFFLLGILFGFYEFGSLSILVCCALTVMISCSAVLKRIQSGFSLIAVRSFSILSYCLIFLLAWIFTLLKTEKNYPFHFSHSKSSKYVVVLKQSPVDKGNTLRAEGEMIQLKSDSGWRVCEGKVLIYFKKNELKQALAYGDRLLFSTVPALVPGPLNPDQFDFRQWLSTHQVYHQVFLKQNEFVRISQHEASALVEWSINLRNKWVKVFHDNGIRDQEYAVLSALILGYDDEINQETMRAYAASGALHILSVSGMHLGIIYGALQVLLAFMNRNRFLRVFRAVLIILFLWFYALLTGLSPSVLRSAMMLTFIVTGQTLTRSTNTANTLGASMIALFLFFSPHLLMQAGFQLSYLAVGGILFLYKQIEDKAYFKSWLGRQIWTILSVSIAAQAATFPLSLFYFHQFPNYFLPSNLVVIPISTAVIFSGITLLIISFWTFLSLKIAWICSNLVFALNESVSIVEHLPYSLLSEIYLTLPLMILWYAAVIFASLYFIRVRKEYLFLFLTLLVALFAFGIQRAYEIQHQQRCIVYHIPKHTCIDLMYGESNIVLTDSFCLTNKNLLNMAAQGYRTRCGMKMELSTYLSIDKPDSCNYFSGALRIQNNKIVFVKRRISILYGNEPYANLTSNSKIIIVSANARCFREFLLYFPQCKKIILDGSNSKLNGTKWKEWCTLNHKEYYNTAENGAWILDLNSDLQL
ncbi:MAG: ComEC/Rec2 family competence protein [Bacteroidia bacterium]